MPTREQNTLDTLFQLPLFPTEKDMATRQNRARFREVIQGRAMQFSVAEAEKKLQNISEEEWMRRGLERALALFHAAAEHVPAYQDFLKNHHVNPESIESIEDFSMIPITDKDSYLRKYPVKDLVWHGKPVENHIIVTSSGSYGPPFLWPRGAVTEAEAVLEHELMLASAFELEQKTTLVLVCFAMGIHIAGTLTMQAIVSLNKKGYPISVMTPGVVTEDILNVIPQIASQYDQLILAGYPPYMKDIVDQGINRGIAWQDLHVRFLLAAEGFNETWRTYMGELTGADPDQDIINIYGSADAGAMGYETAGSIAIRRAIDDDVAAHQNIFDDERLPALYQYYPEHKYFEVVDSELVVTTLGGIPLIRYNIHDNGGIISRSEIAKRHPGLSEDRKNNWPFVYVFGRDNQMVTLYGANIYLEHVRQALEDEHIRQYVSGRILMRTELDENKDQRLCIDIECAGEDAQPAGLYEQITHKIHTTLLRLNGEYEVIYTGIGERALPLIDLLPYGHETFKTARMKHKWTRKA